MLSKQTEGGRPEGVWGVAGPGGLRSMKDAPKEYPQGADAMALAFLIVVVTLVLVLLCLP